jgi:hypothetical protein
LNNPSDGWIVQAGDWITGKEGNIGFVGAVWSLNGIRMASSHRSFFPSLLCMAMDTSVSPRRIIRGGEGICMQEIGLMSIP